MALQSKPRIEQIRSTLTFKEKKQPNVLRTIYMPNYEVDGARDEIEGLKKEIKEERSFYENIMKNMQDDKASFEEQQRLEYMILRQQYEDLQNSLHMKE